MSINDHENWLRTSQVSSSKILFFILAAVQCLDSCFLKSAVFILADQVRSTVSDRWTAQGNSFLQVLCHLLPGGDFNGADNLELEIPLILTKILISLHCPLIKCLKGTPPACNFSSHHLSLKF